LSVFQAHWFARLDHLQCEVSHYIGNVANGTCTFSPLVYPPDSFEIFNWVNSETLMTVEEVTFDLNPESKFWKFEIFDTLVKNWPAVDVTFRLLGVNTCLGDYCLHTTKSCRQWKSSPSIKMDLLKVVHRLKESSCLNMFCQRYNNLIIVTRIVSCCVLLEKRNEVQQIKLTCKIIVTVEKDVVYLLFDWTWMFRNLLRQRFIIYSRALSYKITLLCLFELEMKKVVYFNNMLCKPYSKL